MFIMSQRANQALVNAERPGNPIPFVPLASTAGIDSVVEIRISDMNFVWIYANDRAFRESEPDLVE